MNLHRRHLNESQRAMIGAKLANMRQGRPTEKAANLPDYPVSQAQAAALLQIAERTLRDAKKVQTEAQPEVIQAVEAGHVPVSAAAMLAKAPAKTQREVVAKVMSGEAHTVPQALQQLKAAPHGRPPATLPRRDAEFDRRLTQAQRYLAEVAKSNLIERLGQTYADEAVGGWQQTLEQVGALAKQLAERLQKAFHGTLGPKAAS
jgi:hypothetical protein